MSAYITVEVMRDDIDGGRRGSSSACPVARALRRQTGEAWHVSTYSAWTGEVHTSSERWHRLPQHVEAFVVAFDHHRPVKPFTFRLLR